MRNATAFTKQSNLPSAFVYSVVFSFFEALIQIRNDIYSIILILFIISLVFNYFLSIELKRTVTIVYSTLLISISTLACLYQFHNLTFNFANALWLSSLPLIYIETLLHCSYSDSKSQWQYNRILISLIIALIVLYIYPIETYIFVIIRNSLMYQSSISLLVVNLLLPMCHSFMTKKGSSIDNVDDIKSTIPSTDGNKLLTIENETTSIAMISNN